MRLVRNNVFLKTLVFAARCQQAQTIQHSNNNNLLQ